MGYEAYSYVVYGKLVKMESLEVNSLLDPQASQGLSYYYSDYENKETVVLGFFMANESYSKDSPFVEIKNPTPGMDEEIKQFCEENGIPFKEGDCKTWAFTYHSY